jgi:hypothetical protein
VQRAIVGASPRSNGAETAHGRAGLLATSCCLAGSIGATKRAIKVPAENAQKKASKVAPAASKCNWSNVLHHLGRAASRAANPSAAATINAI